MPGIPFISSFFSSWSAASSSSTTTANSQPASPEKLAITKLIVYPIKSCKGIQVESAEYAIGGLEYDRRWMLIDAETRHMVTARSHPKTFLIIPSLDVEHDTLNIEIPGHEKFSIPITPPEGTEELSSLEVWGSYDLTGHIMSPPGSALQRALSDLVGTEVLLVKSSPQTFRRVLGGQQFLNDVFNALPEYPLEYPLEECTTEFADGYPFLVATEETFDAVEKWLIEKTDDVRIQKPELIERYRPNIVIKGGEKAGFEEDGWEEIKCGGTETLFPVSRCPRCPMPNASPQTGLMSEERMPGKVVEIFRKGVDKINKGPCLGMNAISAARSGTLRVGMEVEVLRRAPRDVKNERPGNARGNWMRVEDRW